MKRYSAAALSMMTMMAALAFCGSAAAQESIFQPPVPIIHLMLDTSGSMQYDVTASPLEDGDDQPALEPYCSTTAGTSGRSRYIMTTEILTGTLGDDYYCESQDRSSKSSPYCPGKDCYTDLPHVMFHGTRQSNGLIDVAGSSVKFSVMTTDGSPEHNGGPNGDYSYGHERIGHGQDKENLGAQNAHSKMGKLVLPTLSEDSASILANNARVKTSILAARPHGGTPLGAFLFDAAYMYQSEPEFTNDPYAACRDRNLILITDGRSNTGDGDSPYTNPVVAAQRMRDLGWEVWVVQFGVSAGVTSQAYDIATYNGILDDDHYMLAQDSESLANALAQTVENIASLQQSRTRTVVTESTGNTTDVQYQFSAAYASACPSFGSTSDSAPGVQTGYLERSVYQCGVDSTCPGTSALAEVQSIGDKLNNTTDGSRYIYTMVGGNLESFESSNNRITNNMLAAPNPSTSSVPDFGLDSTTGFCKNGTLSGSNAEKLAQWRTNLFDYIRASEDSCRSEYKLGAIHHSTPALQDNEAGVSLAIPSFAQYKASIAERPGMLYVATHDGMMHAFRTDRPSATTEPDYWGKEIWAYIPSHQLSTLKTIPAGAETALDGAPVVADIVMSRTSTSRTSEDEDSWKSMLLFGDRAGGRGYTLLDVTDPTAGNWSPVWEVSATNGRCPGGSAACNQGGAGLFRNDFSRLGLSYGRPVIGTVMICPSASGSCSQSQLEEVAVAVFGGGSSEGLSGTAVGKTLFVVRLDTGEKLAEFASGNIDGDFSYVESNCNGNSSLIAADIVGDISCMSTLPGTFLTRCYVGDAAGRLWKVEIGSTERAEWTMKLFYDPYDFTGGALTPLDVIRAPLYEAPALSLTRVTNEPVVVFGTGDMDTLHDATKKSCVVSLTDTMVEDEPDTCLPWIEDTCFRSVGTGIYNGPDVNWKFFVGYDSSLALLTGEAAGGRMMGAPTIYGGVTYFTTFMPDPDNLCVAGTGRVYGIDYILNEGACDVPTPRLPDEDDPYTYVTWAEIGDSTHPAVPYGIVVINRPSCIGGQSIYEAGAGSASGSPFAAGGGSGPQLVIQTGMDVGGDTEETSGTTSDRVINQIVRTIAQVIESIVVGTWGSVFD